MSGAHFCRGCGKRWLTRHKPSCALRGPFLDFVVEADTLPLSAHRGAVCLVDRRARTAPHGDKAAA